MFCSFLASSNETLCLVKFDWALLLSHENFIFFCQELFLLHITPSLLTEGRGEPNFFIELFDEVYYLGGGGCHGR
jgi:hypothetical protein